MTGNKNNNVGYICVIFTCWWLVKFLDYSKCKDSQWELSHKDFSFSKPESMICFLLGNSKRIQSHPLLTPAFPASITHRNQFFWVFQRNSSDRNRCLLSLLKTLVFMSSVKLNICLRIEWYTSQLQTTLTLAAL